MSDVNPLVFISYSWTSDEHRTAVKEIADRLIADSVGVVIDIYDLKEGDDRFVFMEQMVSRSDVTHVLVVSDMAYVEKANQRRRGGVGTESQIISKEVYDKVRDSKFIPLIFEFDSHGDAVLPAFFVSRIGIDFSTAEKQNANWEQLIRRLFGKPLHKKPTLGKRPAYLDDDSTSQASVLQFKFRDLKKALHEGRSIALSLRREYLDLCLGIADGLRLRTTPSFHQKDLAEAMMSRCASFKEIRNALVDWVLLEGGIVGEQVFEDAVLELLEKTLEIASRPSEVNQWQEAWLEAERIFAYETFLYFGAALLKLKAYSALNGIFKHHYLRPRSDNYAESFCTFSAFWYNSMVLNEKLAPEGKKLFSPVAAMVKKQADRSDISFALLMEVDLLTFAAACIEPKTRWFPNLLHYASRAASFPIFTRSARKKDFKHLATILGEEDAEKLKKAIGTGYQRMGIDQHDGKFHLRDVILRGLAPEAWNQL